MGGRAAAWTLLASALSAFTLLRLRSLLSYTFLPLELLLLLWLLPRMRGRWASAAWGCLAGLGLLDYEAWALALPVLCMAWRAEKPSQRPQAVGALTGFFLIAAAVAASSWGLLASYLKVRHTQSLGAGAGLGYLILSNLRGFWFGAKGLGYSGASFWPAFAPWAWGLLAQGAVEAWKRRLRWLLGWVLIGFIPLLSQNSFAEPQRMIVAWLALCLLTGLGAASLFQLRPILLKLALPWPQ
jgi:hypothetical protein